MQHPIADLLGTSLIPELGSDVAAGTACDKELVLVAVAAVRALPHQLASLILNNLDLAVIATLLTEITLGVQLRVHNVIVDKLHYRENCRNISLHIRHLDVADRTARGELLDIIKIYRQIIYYGEVPELGSLLLAVIIGIAFIIIGELLFKKLQKGFAEEF